MNNIRAPFNFVPLNKEVFHPDWASKVYQDIPFSDGENGSMNITITAKTPIYIRNGHKREDKESSEYLEFNNIEGKYFIPGTSIKGLIRNTLRIISKGKMDSIEDSKFSFRDLSNKDEYLNYFSSDIIKCGWLSIKECDYSIEESGIPVRISHTEIDKLLGTKFVDKYKKTPIIEKTAKSKILEVKKSHPEFPVEVSYNERNLNSANPADKRILAIDINKGTKKGIIVFTGQASARIFNNTSKKWSGKFYEFIFPFNSNSTTYKFNESDDIIKNFLFAYKNSEDWVYWQLEAKKGNKIPVFFSFKNGKIEHFGLSYLYKLPYNYKTTQLIYDSHKDPKKDLTNIIFGYSDEKSLKGRVSISNAFIISEKKDIENARSLLLASPKASYYPIYIQQNGKKGEIRGKVYTMMNIDSKLRGWKIYPVKDKVSDYPKDPSINDENYTNFIPLSQGTVFEFKLRFHNLRPIEIGAIIDALEFREYSNIGMAKPYGYGKIKVEIIKMQTNNNKSFYLEKFRNEMNSHFPNYKTCSSLRELSLMSKDHELIEKLEYMKLQEFAEAKKSNYNKGIYPKYLLPYSELVKVENKKIPVIELQAKITFSKGKLVKAKMIDHKDKESKIVDIEGNNIRLKEGDIINVSANQKGGNIKSLIFISKT